MARKRRYGKVRAASRRVGGFFKKRAKRYVKTGGMSNLIQPDAMVYGAIVNLSAEPLNNLTNKIPGASFLGDFKDNVVRGLLAWFGAKKLKGFPQKVCQKGLIGENIMVGGEATTLIKGKVGMSNGSNSDLFSGGGY